VSDPFILTVHQEDMKRWNHFLSKLSPGSEQYVLDEVEKWREGSGSKEKLHDTLKHERSEIEYAISMIEYLKTRIKL